MTAPLDTEALRKVDQTVLGIGNPRANCFQACLAMLSGLDIGECIDITDPAIEDGQWIEPVEQWAATKGWRFVTSAKAPKERPYIANGPTEKREGTHGVVCVGKEMFHDPHPSRDGIVSAKFYAWLEPADALLDRLAALEAEREAGMARVEELEAKINTPITGDFVTAVSLEATHQRERWGSEHDAGKTPFDWFWLIGYLAQKAADAEMAGKTEKALHHTISTAAALANWHAALTGASTTMRPGIEPPARQALKGAEHGQ